MRQFSHNSRFEKLKISIFTALKQTARVVVSGKYASFKKTVALLLLLLFVTDSLVSPEIARSKPLPVIPDIGTKNTLRVYPGVIDASDWSDSENILVPDLPEDALYQEFTKSNAAYISFVAEPEPEPDVSVTGDATSASESEQTEVLPELVPEPSSAEQEISSSTARNVLNRVRESLFTFVLPAMASTTDSVEAEPVSEPTSAGDAVEVVVDEIEAGVVFGQELLTDSVDELLQPEAVTIEPEATTDDLVVSEVMPEPQSEPEPIVEEASKQETETVTGTETNVSTANEDVFTTESEVATTSATTTSEQVAMSTAHFSRYSIALSDFAVPELGRGEMITGLQLRASLAASYSVADDEPLPEFSITYHYGSSSESVGSVVMFDETSNAINGGYQLFSLPQISDVSELEDVSVEITFAGEYERIEGAYIDSVWLEVDTLTITKEDLKQRNEQQLKKLLRAPASHELVSDQLDFSRDELPVFNLKYYSQRSKPVEAIREFLGFKKIKIKETMIKHRTAGTLGITPEVSVTSDGLISIIVPESEKPKFKPGLYTVELTLDEGGKEVVDSFEFEWGLLSINPSQTQYQLGDQVDIYMGALSPNGNTLCDADLRLYVIDDGGYVELVEVLPSGLCVGNNVIDVPDYASNYLPTGTGMYTMYLEHVNEAGEVITHTEDTFEVVTTQEYAIHRNGPTRIYPPATYPMELTVKAMSESFTGTLIERLPAGFSVYDTEADVKNRGEYIELSWDMSVLSGTTKTVSYSFDAPDISPYLYELGPAELLASRAVSAATGTSAKTGNVFLEHREWQIASDAVGQMILFWDDGASIPTGWSCLSCGSGDFYQNFAVGSSTYGNTGGSATHNHTAGGSVLDSGVGATESGDSTVFSATDHSHTNIAITVTGTSTLPRYRELRVIQYDNPGEPTTIPAGAIGVFDVASSSLPSGWWRYADQDGYYVYGGDTPGTVAGSNEHTHDVSGLTNAADGTDKRQRGGGTPGDGATSGHTHTIDTATPLLNQEPPYVEVLLAKLDADAVAPNNLITMWSEEVPSGWIDVSSGGSDPFNNKFLKASTSYGTTGGAIAHTHADMTGITSSLPSGTGTGREGTAGAAASHTHSVSVTSFTTASNLPPYISAVFGKRQGTDPVYDQLSYWWYVDNDNITPADAWPSGGTDLVEGEPVTATSTPLKSGDIIRLRINTEVTNATSTAGAEFKLQFAEADSCSGASTWLDVGDTASTSVWRGYNTSATDHATLPSQLLASSTVSATYEENGYSTTTPNDIGVDAVGEWDFVLEDNGATPGANYCFRMTELDGTTFALYSKYPQLLTNAAPTAPVLSVPFDNEMTASTTDILFRFVTSDPEGEDLHYQVQIDNNYDFSPTMEDKTSLTSSSKFLNLILSTTDKAPYVSGNLMQFTSTSTYTDGNTYYWRVRAMDPSGSGEWGEWSEIDSFTIEDSLDASAWHQTEDEQFDKNTLAGVETGGDDVDLITGSTTGTTTSTAIVFSDGQLGTAWESFEYADNTTSGSITYRIQYYTDSGTWEYIPDSALPNNSTGLGSSPVSLLGLDVNTYDTIRLEAVLVNSGGSPILLDWTVYWGYRVETPTITRLFPNEKTATTTPLFEFTTTDPKNNALTYQIAWSTDYTFAASTTRTSDTHAGFSNYDDQFDSDPFTSGDTIQFQMQGADALSDNTTYWWRVRAKDSGVNDAYSFWTDPQSFTVDTSVVASTWFQTTEEQFDTDVLSGTNALASDAVSVATTATEALVVYGEGTSYVPRYRLWNGSSWSAEGDLQNIGAPLRWSKVKAGTTREEYTAAIVGTDGDVSVQVYALGVWDDLQEVTTDMGSVSARGFDVAYETLSGDALIAYCDNASTTSKYNYAIWNGTSWSAPAPIAITEADCEWIQLASDPTSDELVILTRGSDGNPYEAQVWDGDAWGDSTTQGLVSETAHEGMSVLYEESGNQALIVTSDGNPGRFRWNSWNGTTWGTAATVGLGDDFEWGTLVADKGSDDMALCYVDEDATIGTARWGGASWSWAASDQHVAPGYTKADPTFACVYENTPSRDNYILTVYSDSTQTSSTSWNGSAWTTGQAITGINASISAELQRTGTEQILGVFFDDSADTLYFSEWNGTGWSTVQTLEDDASVDTPTYGRPYSLAPRNSGTEGTVIVSPAIDFNDGSGPYWQEMSWVDSTPGSSDILYSIQYYDGDSWEFVPDVEIPNNSIGTSTGIIDLSGLDTSSYRYLRPYAALMCDGSGFCPLLQDWTVKWSEGITVAGSLLQYDQSTSVSGATIAVAVNGVLEVGKTDTTDGSGNWSISNVTAYPGDTITVFVNGANPGDVPDANEAIGVTRYDGSGDISGFNLFERHVALGSDDSSITLTNTDLGLYTTVDDEDAFLGFSGSTLNLCADAGCEDVELYINASTTYRPGSNVVTHDVENNGTFVATTTIHVSGSWDDNATSTLTGSTVVFTATSTDETIDQTGANSLAFNNIVFGTTTTVSATWALTDTLDVNGDLTVEYGTLVRGTNQIALAGDLLTGTNGYWSGWGTTTFDGSLAVTWGDLNPTLQNIGYVVIDGSTKVVTLSGNVAAQTLTIGTNDSLDVSGSNHDITLYGYWSNTGTFIARSGEVLFAATTSGHTIDVGGDSFYDLTFTGANGTWSFDESLLTVSGDLSIATGTLILPSNGTTTLAGSFSSAGGTFVHNNGLIDFTSTGPATITASGTAFDNTFYSMRFSGSGSWTMLDVHATSSNDVTVQSGSVTFPSGIFAVGGSLRDNGGSFSGNNGTVRLYSTLAESIQAGGSSFSSLQIAGSGTFDFLDTSADINGDLIVDAGTLTLPSGTLTIGGSLLNSSTIDANGGQITFDSADTGETINLGASSVYDVAFAGATGGWTIINHATATNDVSLTNANDWTLNTGYTLSVGGTFTNAIGASTTWSGATLSLEAGAYSLNTKTDDGDQYETLRIAADTDIAMWNSAATTTTVGGGGSLYSQDHAGNNGELYIYGDFVENTSNVYWSHETDFDGTNLGTTSARQADVYLAAGATVTISDVLFEVVGSTTASTTIQNQGSGTYTIAVSGGTTTAQYYDFADLGLSGVSLLASTTVTTLRDGSFTVGTDGGSALTVSSTTIDNVYNQGLQIYNVNFATATAISATNVSQTDGAANSYWWFRSSTGNLDGENFDNDLGPIAGNPGTVRWDDSALTVTIAGHVYKNDELSPLNTSTCGTGTPVTVVVEGGGTHVGACNGGDGSFSIGGVTIVGDPTVTVYLDGADNGEQAVTLTKTVTADIYDLDLYVDRVIVRHEDVAPMTIDDMAAFDYDNDPDIPFVAATTSTPDLLTVFDLTELHIWATSTFTPGGDIVIAANASTSDADGTLHIGADAIFQGAGTSTYTFGGSIDVESGGSFLPAQTVVIMNATTTGKYINTAAGETINFNELRFTGTGGLWNLNGNASTTDDVWVADGIFTGDGNLTLTNGSFYGDGLVSFGTSSTVAIYETNTFGGAQPWLLHNLVLGTGLVVGTTTPASTATTTISGVLTISNAHHLDAGSSHWLLTGADDVLVETGTFHEDTSTVTYGGTADMNILSTDYYNLFFNAPAGAPTYIAEGLGIQVFGDLTVGNTTLTTVNFANQDPALNVDGDFTILSNGVFIASDSNTFTIAGNYDNSGIFTHSGGTVIFDGSTNQTVAAGSSSFGSVLASSTANLTFAEPATSSATFTLRAANDFILSPFTSLAVGGTFLNELGGANTVWTDSTLHLYSGGNYEINASTTADVYGTLSVAAGTQIRMWNSGAATATTDTGASVYSMDHAGNNGHLYIFGDYTKTAGTDYWSYATDFDGTDISSSQRLAQVFIEAGSSLVYSGGGLQIIGGASGSTTIQNQGSGTYDFSVSGGTLNANYYEIQNMGSDGLSLSGTPTVTSLSYGQFTVGANNYRALTVNGSVITQNPARTFTNNVFATSSGVSVAYNSSSTGSTASGWKFTNHSGDIDGETFDLDLGPNNGNPGYVSWDNSSSTIVISGTVYEDEGSTVSSACDGSTQNIRMIINGVTSTSTSCDGNGAGGGSGYYAFAPYSYPDNSTIIVYIDNEASHNANTITYDPFTTVADLDLYENRVIVRHEGSNPLTITQMADWDNDTPGTEAADMLYTANGNLVLDADTKLIVWDDKEFAPGGDVTISGGGVGAAYDGTLELYPNSTYTTAAGEIHTIGGSLIAQSGATYDASTATTTFTTTGAARTIDINDGSFYNISFTGSGSWSIVDNLLDVHSFYQTSGTLTHATSGTTTVSGYWNTSGGSFDINDSLMIFDGVSSNNTVVFGGSDVAELRFTGSGSWVMNDINATATKQVLLQSGGLTLPSGSLWVEGDFLNTAGTITHNNSLLIIATSSTANLQASSSSLYGVTFTGGGTYAMLDENLALLDTLTLIDGSLTLASGTLSIGGSFLTSGGTFDHASGTILFNSAAGTENITPGASNFAYVQFGSAGGDWTITGNATTTGNFTLLTASSFTQAPGTTLAVQGVFSNSAGAATDWTNTTIKLLSGTDYAINTKAAGGDVYANLYLAANMNIEAWESSATNIEFADYTTSSFYSQDHATNNGYLYIYGTYTHATGTEYWSRTKDFNGDDLSGSPRAVSVFFVTAATSSFSMTGGTLEMAGVAGASTTVQTVGAGTYAFAISGGTFSPQYYEFSGMNGDGLSLSGTPTITSLSYGSFLVGVNGGTAIDLASATLNANASKIINNVRFATSSAITAYNVTLTGTTPSAWRFQNSYGNLSGENFDVDGATACGSIRFDDSACLLTEQTHYRWRNDDGGLGVPDTEWFDSNWTKRKSVRIKNSDGSTYTNAVVGFTVVDDTASIRADFGDLRFTDSDGTTELDYFIASTSADGSTAEAWVEIPSLAANSTKIIYMYYGYTVATSNASATATFIAADDFEDGDINEYSGDTGLFNLASTYAYGSASSYGLDNAGEEDTRPTDGIARFDQTISRGETIRYHQYFVNNGSDEDEVCTMFAVQSPVTSNQNYGVCLELYGTDRISLVKNVESTDSWGSVSVLSNKAATLITGWYTVEVDWGTDTSIFVSLYNDAGTLLATTSATDSSYSSGGFGFTHWGNRGGWDAFTVRPTLTTEPTVSFGAEVGDSGASWAAALDTATSFDSGDVARLRISVENSGTPITDQTFEIEFAEKGAAPSCESVDGGEYIQVPTAASCGSSPICMSATTNYSDGADTADLLQQTLGVFTAGKAIKENSNTTGSIDIDQDEFTELEYAITPTATATGTAYCLRVTDTDDGELDTYLAVAELGIVFEPTITAVSLNGGLPIALTPGTTTTIYTEGTVTDQNGVDDIDIDTATATVYRGGVGAACTADDNNCYITTGSSTCALNACGVSSCTLSCSVDIAYHADPTSDGTYSGEEWFAFLEIKDNSSNYGFDSSSGVELNTLRALDVDNQIAYGTLGVYASTTSGTNPLTLVKNYGNEAIDVKLSGTDMTDGGSSVIDPTYQRAATTTFDYSNCGACATLTATGTTLEIDLIKPTTTTPYLSDDVYWGIRIPYGTAGAAHSGTNTFTAVAD